MNKEEIANKIDEIQQQMIDGILEVVKMDSTQQIATSNAPYGTGIAMCLDKVLEIAQSLGFETVNVDNQVGYAQLGKGEDYIGIVGHLDVVPTQEGWNHPPFSGYINEEGRIFSRGILDNKGPIMSCLYALYALKELQVSLSKPVRIIFGTNEETGMQDIPYYLKKEKPPIMGFTPDCKYPVVYAERGRAKFRYQYQKSGNIDEFLNFVNIYFIHGGASGEALGIHYHDEEFGWMQLREYTLGSNQDAVYVDFSISYPASYHLDTLQQQLSSNIIVNMEFETLSNINPVFFQKDSILVKTLQQAYEEMTGLDGTPVTTTGGTYAKVMPNIVPFGPSFPGQKGIGHLPNEWMDIKDIILNAKIYAYSIYLLAK